MAAIPILLIALPLALFGYYANDAGRRIEREGIGAEASVQAMWTTTRRHRGFGERSPSRHYHLRYGFTTAAGESMTAQAEITQSLYIRLEMRKNRGEDPLNISVRYSASDPAISEVEPGRLRSDGFWHTVAAVIVALVPLLLVGLWIRSLFRAMRRDPGLRARFIKS